MAFLAKVKKSKWQSFIIVFLNHYLKCVDLFSSFMPVPITTSGKSFPMVTVGSSIHRTARRPRNTPQVWKLPSPIFEIEYYLMEDFVSTWHQNIVKIALENCRSFDTTSMWTRRSPKSSKETIIGYQFLHRGGMTHLIYNYRFQRYDLRN